MNNVRTVSLVAALVSAVMAIGLVGCEDASNKSLNVAPPSATLDTTDAGSAAQVFVASTSDSNSAAFFPLVWSVSDAGLGNIAGQGGASAIYTRTDRLGNNIITVRDAGGREGVAVVTQK